MRSGCDEGARTRKARCPSYYRQVKMLVFLPRGVPVESRIEGLECKLMDAEDQLETLNLTVFRQQQHIERLERQLEALKQMVISRLPETGRRLEDEVPPHY